MAVPAARKRGGRVLAMGKTRRPVGLDAAPRRELGAFEKRARRFTPPYARVSRTDHGPLPGEKLLQ